MRFRTVSVALLLSSLWQPSVALAQDDGLANILVRLIQNEVRLSGPQAGSQFPSHEAHFLPGEDQRLTPYLFNQAIVSQLSTFPLGSSSGGFSYSFDPNLGTYSRSTNSFGPSFTERAITIGKNRWSAGANYQHATYKSFEGKNIDNGDIRFYLPHMHESGAFFEGDVVQAALALRLETDTFSMFANYGVTDRLDVGIAIPIIHVDLDASIDATILRLATGDSGSTSGIHTFPGGASTATFSEGGTASGLGDILLRAKYHVLRRAGGGVAVALDFRAPTGNADDLLGTGASQANLMIIGSSAVNRFLSPHFNIGFTASGNSSNELIDVTNELNYSGGVEFVPSPRVTIAADVIGRRLQSSGRLVEKAQVFNWTTVNGVSGSTTFTEFAREDGSLNLVTGAIGVKFNPHKNLLVSASVLLPMTNAGLRSNPIPVIGFDYTF